MLTRITHRTTVETTFEVVRRLTKHGDLDSLSAALESSSRGRQLENSGNTSALPAIRLLVASTFNVKPIAAMLRAAFEGSGMWAEVDLAPFGQVSAALLDPEAMAGRPSPDVVALVASCEDDLAAYFRRPGDFRDNAEYVLVDSRIAILSDCVKVVASRVKAVVVVAVSAERGPAVTGLRPFSRRRRRDVADRYLAGVLSLDRLAPNIVTVDWTQELLEAGFGMTRDPRLWYLARMRLDYRGLSLLAVVIARYVRAVTRPAVKVVAVDLDGTLWGGVLEEVGVRGLELGDEGVGLAFADLQRELLKLRDSGIALALCSKNDHATAIAAMEQHAGMVLRTGHFAATRIDRRDKAEMLQELADELGFGLDRFVFLDDSPVERDWVRRALPEVVVPEMPNDPACRPSFVAALDAFDRMELTEADLKRELSREASAGRAAHRRLSANYEAFLASLGQHVEIARVQESTVPRAAQLSERTTQFTLGTKVFTAGEIAALMHDSAVEVCTVVVRDRFEDSGITGLMIVRFAGASAHLEIFLLSCRVLGRRIEDAMLAFVVARALARGAKELRVRYAATARNDCVCAFLARRGLAPDSSGPDNGVYRVALHDRPLAAEWPSHLAFRGEFAP